MTTLKFSSLDIITTKYMKEEYMTLVKIAYYSCGAETDIFFGRYSIRCTQFPRYKN